MAKSKSAYSTPGKQGRLDTHIIVVWVDNEAGVLARVVGLFSGRDLFMVFGWMLFFLLYSACSLRRRSVSSMTYFIESVILSP